MDHRSPAVTNGKIKKPCAICEAPSCGIRCGVISCSACAVFFRRAVRLNSKFICKHSEACLKGVGYKTCGYCRLEKCHASGMVIGKPRRVPHGLHKGHTMELPSVENRANCLNPPFQSLVELNKERLDSLKSIYDNYKEQLEIRKGVERRLLFPDCVSEPKFILSTEKISSDYIVRLKLCHVSFLTNSFQCFRELEDGEKLTIFESSMSSIVVCEMYYLSYINFSPDQYDKRYIMSNYTYTTYDTLPYFWKEYKLKSSQENFELLVTKMRGDLFNSFKGTTIMAQMELMDEEYAAILSLCTWNGVLRADVISEKIRDKCHKMKNHIFSELRELYRRKNIENYYERFADITTLLVCIDHDTQQMIDNFALMHIFDLTNDKSLMCEYNRKPDFNNKM